MVKKWIIILTIFVGLVLTCVWESSFINNSFENMIDRIICYKQMLYASKDNISTAENLEYLEFLHDDFHQKEKVLKNLIWHTGLKDIEVSISRIMIYVEENDFTEAMTETNALIDYCKHYQRDFDLSLENIL